jgi:cytochrome P450
VRSLGIPVRFIPGGVNHDVELFEDSETFDPDYHLRSECGSKAGVGEADFRPTLMFGAGRVSYYIVRLLLPFY